MGGPPLLTVLATQEKRGSGTFPRSIHVQGTDSEEFGWDNHHERLCDVWHINISSEGWSAIRQSVHQPKPRSLSCDVHGCTAAVSCQVDGAKVWMFVSDV